MNNSRWRPARLGQQPRPASFTSPDPLDGVNGTPTVANPYHYADNDPLNKTDPTGLRPSDCSMTLKGMLSSWSRARQYARSGGEYIRRSDEGDGTSVKVHGDVGCARYVAFFVPGTGTTSANFGGFDQAARNFYDDAARIVGPNAIATVAWLGYDTPGSLWDARDTDEGKAGGEFLAGDLRFLSAFGMGRYPSDQTLSLVTHSYGSLVAGYAITGFGARVDNVITVGSPGFGPGIGSEEALGGTRVWAGLAEGDEITGWYMNNGYHGTDPHGSDFDGACRFDTSDNSGHGAITESGKGYFDRRTSAYNNILRIIISDYGSVGAHDGDPDCP